MASDLSMFDLDLSAGTNASFPNPHKMMFPELGTFTAQMLVWNTLFLWCAGLRLTCYSRDHLGYPAT